MIDPTALVPMPQDSPLQPFSETSRYRGLPLVTYVDPEGREHVYVARRLVPLPEAFAVIGQIEVREGDRIDNIAANVLGDPEAYWRIADANRALAPAELTQRIGRKLAIALPEGVPAPKRI